MLLNLLSWPITATPSCSVVWVFYSVSIVLKSCPVHESLKKRGKKNKNSKSPKHSIFSIVTLILGSENSGDVKRLCISTEYIFLSFRRTSNVITKRPILDNSFLLTMSFFLGASTLECLHVCSAWGWAWKPLFTSFIGDTESTSLTLCWSLQFTFPNYKPFIFTAAFLMQLLK